ncbi:TonB-dependent receptor SusC [Pedobacter glucosidilyticus]|nr:TonB-dependent receptor [Pedobacter glucosidilyticus]KHJ39290.1 TonB-dependent receptor SusC [Pedobacter glucosidilyticus]
MRSFILGIFTVLQIAENGYSQPIAYSKTYAYASSSNRVDSTKPVGEQGQQLSTMLKSLEEQYKVRFNYDSKLLKDKLVKAGIITESNPLEQVLLQLLSPFDLNYEKVKESQYVIYKNKKSLADIAITGKVVDAAGMPLPGVSVRIKGSTTGTTTDVNGKYTINIPDAGTVLVFSFIGFTSQEIVVNNQKSVDVTLIDDSKTLSEVVVVGYGTQKRADITGSVAIVNTSDMLQVSSNDVGQLLQGRVSGVAVNSDGQPGAFPQVRIRGISTFGNSDPLYVIDGVPINGVPRDFNPNDIESVQVLKDASAGAVYGSRAANGVVIITTKQGKKNSPLKVEYAGYYGVDEVWQIMPVTGRANYQALNNEARFNAGKPLAPANDPNSNKYITNIDTDWQKEGLKTGNRQNHYVNFSGGGNNTTYNVSLDLFDNNGTFVGNGPTYKRYTARVNTMAEKGIFKIGQTFNYTRSNENSLIGNEGVLLGARPPLINDLVFAIPTMALYDPTVDGGFGGTLQDREDAISLNGIGYNSLVSNKTDVDRMFGTIFGELQLLKRSGHNLKYKVNVGYDRVFARDNGFIPTFNLGYFFPNVTARLTDNSRTYGSTLLENTLSYDKTFGKHSIALLAGQMYQRDLALTKFAYAEGFVKPYFPTLANGSTSNSSAFEEYHTIASYLGRLNYNYDNKYLITATLRRDGSSRFAKANRYGNFPSVALGWKISEESFFKLPKSLVSDLKIRASWGRLGNENIGNYLYLASVNPNIVYTFNDVRVLGGLQTNVVSETIKWEERETSNIGLDATLFSGKLDLSAEYYNSKSSDILVGIPIPASVGSINSFPTVNAGALRNTGVELSATYRKMTGDFKYDITANFTTIKNKVLSLGNDVQFREGVGSYTEIGGEVGRHYGWVADGIFQTQAEVDAHATQFPGTTVGDIRFKDLNDDDIINEDDRTYLGSGIPRYTYGLNIGTSYKRFDFTVFLSGSAKFLINSRLYRDLMHTGGDANYHEDMLNRWTTTNTNTNIPRLDWNDVNQNGRNSNREGWLQDGTFVRINTISLGYTLPKSFIKGVSNARLYATAQNLYTFQKYKAYNPDFTAGVFEPGFDNGSYPRPRTIMLGVQVGF